MAASDGKKTYGLIIPKRGVAKKSTLKPNIFGDDSDEEEKPVRGKKFGQTNNTRLKTQTQLEIQKALEDDPSVYEYDTIYDDMQQKKIEKNSTLLQGKEKKSKYINNLLKAAEVRKKEDERRKERSVQKERDEEQAEGKFQDKEEYVTSAYKQKLVEMEKEAEEERRKAALEDAMDVTKQKDLSGFYRHFLNQQTGEEEIPDNTRVKKEKEVKTEPTETTTDTKDIQQRLKQEFPEDRDDERRTSSDSDSSDENSKISPDRSAKKGDKSSKHYRKRHDSEVEDDRPEPKSSNGHRSSSKKYHRSRSRSRDRRSRSKSPVKSRYRKSRSADRSRSPQKSRSRRSRSRSHERSRKKDDHRKRRSGSRDRKSLSPRSRSEDTKRGRTHEEKGKRDKNRDRDRNDPHKERHESSKKRGKVDESETADVKRIRKDSGEGPKAAKDKSNENPKESLAQKFAKRNVGAAVDDARARYLARKKQRTTDVEAEEN